MLYNAILHMYILLHMYIYDKVLKFFDIMLLF